MIILPRLRRLIVLPFLIGTLSAHAGDQDVAQRYYARLARQRAAENTLGRRSSTASGVVRNSRDEPIAGATVFVIRDDGESPAQRAKNLLIYWFDPEDGSLIRQWAKEDALEHFRLDVEGIGGSPGEASSAYAEAHFTREPKTFHYFTDPVFSPDCNHAYAVFVVRYAHWGYWQPIVLLHEGDQWKVKLAGEGGTWHDLSPDGPAIVYPPG
jgi:hypothetical protein